MSGESASNPPLSAGRKASHKASLKSEIVYTGTQMFTAMDSAVLWGWIEAFLISHIHVHGTHIISPCHLEQSKVTTSGLPASVVDDPKCKLELIQFLLSVLPLVSTLQSDCR